MTNNKKIFAKVFTLDVVLIGTSIALYVAFDIATALLFLVPAYVFVATLLVKNKI